MRAYPEAGKRSEERKGRPASPSACRHGGTAYPYFRAGWRGDLNAPTA